MRKLFTSESVTEGHPDKVCDQISDAVLDAILAQDPTARVACETTACTGHVQLMGEITTTACVDYEAIARRTIREIGYTDPAWGLDAGRCDVSLRIDAQSPDIAMGTNEAVGGAGDQGMMFGYACNETPELMPLPITLAHIFLQELTRIRKEGKQMLYLRPDAKSQITVQYSDEGKPQRIEAIVISTQHDEFDEEKAMLERIRTDVKEILIPRVLARLSDENRALFAGEDYKLFVNPTGKFVIGGPHGDTGLTGRKIIVDTYGGRGAHGGGAFSGKDPSKVDRSAAYATRHIAKNMVAAGVCDEVLVQVAYAIGVAEPVGLYVNTYGTAHVAMTDGEIAQHIGHLFDMRPYAIIERFGLKNPIYAPTAAYGHIGRDPYTAEVTMFDADEKPYTKTVDFFAWEKLDYVEPIRKEFGL